MYPLDEGNPRTAAEAFRRYLELHPQPPIAEYCLELPEFAAELRRLHAEHRQVSRALEALGDADALLGERMARVGVDGRRGPGLEPESDPPDEAFFEELLRKLRIQRDGSRRYRVKGVVGEGGMGIVLKVWDSELRRHMAMKLVRRERSEFRKGGRDDAVSVGRFLDEALVTAQLEHPGIVPVHEIGLDDQDNLYFTMRLVRGESLGEVFRRLHAHESGWDLGRVLWLVLRACEALAYAHSKGVIHRDLKPSNIMVGPFGEVYVMDWGLARILPRQGSEATAEEDDEDVGVQSERAAVGSSLRTQEGDAVGTPYYMSPEQASGRNADLGPASDVYSVGAILYHLAAGRMPYAEQQRTLAPLQVQARVLQGPPVSLAGIAPTLPAELVAVIEKAMARDPARRYADAGALADDLRRFLEHRVVQAHRTGALAELVKWVERNRGAALASVAAVLVAIVGLTGVSVVQATGKREAEKREETTTRVAIVLQEVLASFAPTVVRDQEVSAKELLDFTEEVVRRSLVGDADRQARIDLLHAMGMGANNRGDWAEGARLFRDVLSELAQQTAPDWRRAYNARRLLGVCLNNLGFADEAEVAHLDALEALARGQVFSPEVAAALAGIARIFRDLQRTESAARIEGLLPDLRLAGELGSDVEGLELQSLSDLANVFRSRGEYAAGQGALELVLEVLQARPGHADFKLHVLHSLAQNLRSRGQLARAEETVREVISARLGQGETHPRLIHAYHTLGLILSDGKRHSEAEECFRKSSDLARRVLEPGDSEVYRHVLSLGQLLLDQGRLEEASPLLEEALEGFRSSLGENHEAYISCRNSLGNLRAAEGKNDESLSILGETLRLAREHLDEAHPLRSVIASNYVGRLRQAGRIEEAYSLQAETLASYQQAQGPDGPYAQDMRVNLVYLCGQTDRLEQAMSLVEEILAHAEPGSMFERMGLDLKGRVQASMDALVGSGEN